MITEKQRLKAVSVYFDRWRSFIDEGYQVKKIYTGNHLGYVMLGHDNGNIITVFIDKRTYRVYQRLKGKVVWEFNP